MYCVLIVLSTLSPTNLTSLCFKQTWLSWVSLIHDQHHTSDVGNFKCMTQLLVEWSCVVTCLTLQLGLVNVCMDGWDRVQNSVWLGLS